MHILRCFLVAAYFASVYAAKLPFYIKPCSSTDPNLDRCVENVIRIGGPIILKGVPDLDVPSMDPMYLGTININNHGLNITFKDTVITGLSAFHLHSAHLNMTEGKLNLNYTINVTLKAHYTAAGEVLFLPIKGEGEGKIKIRNMNNVFKCDVTVVDNHWNLANFKTIYKIGHANLEFTNLFGGNKELANITLRFLNDNWKDVIYELAYPAMQQIEKRGIDNMKKITNSVPASELLLE